MPSFDVTVYLVLDDLGKLGRSYIETDEEKSDLETVITNSRTVKALTTQLVALPTTMFLAVYVATTAAGVRLLTGRARLAAAMSCAAVGVVLAFAGGTVLLAVLVAGVAVFPRRKATTRKAASRRTKTRCRGRKTVRSRSRQAPRRTGSTM